MNAVISASILAPLYELFGWLTSLFYQLLGNYGLAIVFFSLIIRGAFIPLSVKSGKSMLATHALQPRLAELQRLYGKDREKYAQAQMALYKENGVSMAGGCLPSLIQLILIWPMFRVLSCPLNYVMGVGNDKLTQIVSLLKDKGLVGMIAPVDVSNIPVLQALHDNPSVMAEAVHKGLIRAGELMDLRFLGLNLGLTPTLDPGRLFGSESRTWLPLLIIPILTAITAFIPQMLAERTNPVIMMNRRQKELAKNNPARQAQSKNNEQMEQMNRMMRFMPILSIVFSFTMPAAMGIYIIVSSLTYIASTIITYYLYNKPFAELLLAHESGAISDEELVKRNGEMSKRQLAKIERGKLRAEKLRAMQEKMQEQQELRNKTKK